MAAQKTLRERPLGVHPLEFASESCAFCHPANLLDAKLVTALRPDGLAFIKINCEIAVDGNRLPGPGPQMHFNPLFELVVTRFVLKLFEVEIGAELAIDAG